MRIRSEQLCGDLQAIQGSIGEVPVLIHTDLLRVGMIADPADRDSFCAAYAQVLDEVFGHQSYLIPTFNYDYCRSGTYDIEHTPSEVGALTDYYRRYFSNHRTHTPVFHFCIQNNRDFTMQTRTNCFDQQSTFGELVAADGVVLFLGAPLSANTFVHHVEEICDVPYRTHKQFSGHIIRNGVSQPANLTYRVRPLDGSVQYDWDRIEIELTEEGILKKAVVGATQALFFQARQLRDYWSRQIQANPRALLI